jgi:regulatory protein
MVVTQLEEIGQSKVNVYIDGDYAFLLYQKDIEKFGLIEGCEIASKIYEEIIEDTVFRRAKQKALAIPKFMDRTEQELRIKLTDAGYPENIVNRTISYIYEYGYLNDERYTITYVRSRMNTKSKLVIKTELLHKGIAKELVDRILQEEYENHEENEEPEDAELIAIRKAVAKKTKALDTLSSEDKQKLIASLYRKGFDIGKIKQIVL